MINFFIPSEVLYLYWKNIHDESKTQKSDLVKCWFHFNLTGYPGSSKWNSSRKTNFL